MRQPPGPSRPEPCFCLFQPRAVAGWWYREAFCRFLRVSMSLPVPSAAGPQGSRGHRPGFAHALGRTAGTVELGASLGTLGLGVLIWPLPLTRCATLGKSLNLSGLCFLLRAKEGNDC